MAMDTDRDMEWQSIEQRMYALDNKMDLLLEYVNEQRLRSQSYQDLINDLSIVGKDIYDTTVEELEKQSVELDPSQITLLASKFLKNLPNFIKAMDTFESTVDLMRDAAPIANEVMIDMTHKLHELEQKGYIEFFKETTNILDNIVTSYSAQDVRQLSDNIVTILDTIRALTQPEMMKAIHNAVKIFGSIEQENIPSYSLFKVIREMNSPEMKKALGFMMVFMKNLPHMNKT